MTEDQVARYWAKVRRTEGGCWEWTGAVGQHGYGVLKLGYRCGTALAKHIALELDGWRRPPAPNNHALHGDCSNRRCVNPKHLRWGNNVENIADKMRLGRQARGMDLHRSTLTEDDVRAIRQSPDTQRALAVRYRICQPTVSNIQRRKIWRHVA